MFKTLNQSEMLCVNGGFKYIPVYQRVVHRYIKNGSVVRVVYTNDLYFTGHLEQVASTDSRTRIISGYHYVNHFS
ncbi:MAG: hypothetical protein J5738_03840 [Lachnospiraceae bacterium]|nr:hypothetical protein [Lachnospiraceae bacterium]